MSWDDLKFFLHVVRGGNLSAAARALDVAQPTVSRRIESLEERTGALFDRGAKGLTLSPLGEELVPFVESMAQQTMAIEQCVARQRSAPGTTVRIATTLGLATHWLTEKISVLQAANPDLALSVQVGIQRSDLMHRDADVALRMGAPGDEGLVGRRVGRVGCGLYASRDYLDKHGTPRTLKDLRGHTIVESEGEIANLRQSRVLREHASMSVLGTNNATIQIAAVEAGLGIAAMCCFMVDPSPKLVRVLRETFDVQIELWLLANPSIKDRPAVRAVLEHLGAEAKRDAARLAGSA